ncbi:hypothetical protein THAOC_36522 [Thalassiosira oceanica]|uniref:AP2/ERF domain-containing protein n=1 Tax=Thalassiosira oceanica TaxID=159749 RepID=K0R021_THAOC|nr:hypothetical protein THAOC_36522 [Thalassiosira oceanica]|eukprot:EJK44905.1 hypothetical protein THAOC_36522 [Thalassiosira oceanica]
MWSVQKRPSAHTQRKKDAAAQFPQRGPVACARDRRAFRGPVAALPAAAASWELTETHRHHVDVVSLSFFILLIAHYPNEMDFKATPKIALPPGLGIDVAPSSASTPTPLDRRPPRKFRKPSSSMPSVVWPPSNAKQFKIDSTVSRSNYSSNCCSIKPSGSSGSSLRGVTQRPSGKWQAQVYYAGRSRYLGVFETREECLAGYKSARQVADGPLAKAAKSEAQINSIVELMRASANCGRTTKRSKKKVSETDIGEPQYEQPHEKEKLGGIAARSPAFTRGLAKHPYFVVAKYPPVSKENVDAESSKENGQLFFHSTGTDRDRLNRAEATPRPTDTVKPAATDSATSEKHLPLKKRRALISSPIAAESLLPFDGEKRIKASPPEPKTDNRGTAKTFCGVGYSFSRPLKGDDGADLGWHEAHVVQELDGGLRLVLYPSVGFVETLSLRDLEEIQYLTQNQ